MMEEKVFLVGLGLQPGEECVIGGKVADQGLLLHAGGGGVDSLVGGDLGLLLTDG